MYAHSHGSRWPTPPCFLSVWTQTVCLKSMQYMKRNRTLFKQRNIPVKGDLSTGSAEGEYCHTESLSSHPLHPPPPQKKGGVGGVLLYVD